MVNYYFGTTFGNFIVSHPNDPTPIRTWNPPHLLKIISYPLENEWEQIQSYQIMRTRDQMRRLDEQGKLPNNLKYNVIRAIINPNWNDYPSVEFALTSRGGIIFKIPHSGSFNKSTAESLRAEVFSLIKRLFGLLNIFITLEEPRLNGIFIIRNFMEVTDNGLVGPNFEDWDLNRTYINLSHFSETTNLLLNDYISASIISYRVIHHDMISSILNSYTFPLSHPFNILFKLLSGGTKNWLDNNYIASYSIIFTGIEVFLKHFEMEARRKRVLNGESIDLTQTPNLSTIIKNGKNQNGNHILTNHSSIVIDKIYELRRNVLHEGYEPTKMEASKLIQLLKWLILHKISSPTSIFKINLVDYELNPLGDWISSIATNPRSSLNNNKDSPFYFWINH